MDPETSLILFLLGGLATVVTFGAHDMAEKMGPHLTAADLRPCFPGEGPPLPVFMVKRPELLSREYYNG